MSEVTQLSADFQSSFATVEFLKNVVEKCDATAVSTTIQILAASRAAMSLDALREILDLIGGDLQLIECLDKLLEGTLGIMQYGDGTRGVLLREASNINMQEVWKSGATSGAARINQGDKKETSSSKKRKLTEKAAGPAKKRGRPPKKSPAASLSTADDVDGKVPANKDGPAPPAMTIASPVNGVTPKKRGRPPKKAATAAAAAADTGNTPKKLGRPPKVVPIDSSTIADKEAPPKKKRDRTPKNPVDPNAEAASPKKQGRPPKNPIVASSPVADLSTFLPAIPSQASVSQGDGTAKTWGFKQYVLK